MAEQNNENKNFGNVGSDAYRLNEEAEAPRGKVLINIDENEAAGEGVVLRQNARDLTNLSTFDRINNYLISKTKVKPDTKANFFHLLSVMINAGIPMVKALRSLASQEANKRFQLVVSELANKIEVGMGLSQALASEGSGLFTEQDIGMVQSGEASGQLNKVLESLAIDLEKSSAVKKKVKSALMYPTVVMVLLVLVIAGMMIFVIPNLKDLFDSQGGELPLITRAVIGLSDFMVAYYWLMLAVIVGIYLGLKFLKKTESGAFYLDNLMIHLPIFGKLMQKSYLARMARTLGSLLDSSLSMVMALEITARSVGNEVYKNRILMAAEDVKQGITLVENFSDSPLFPPMMVNMVDVGEKTAQLDSILIKVAHFYEEEVDTAVGGISKLIEPLVIVVIGLTVGAVVAAIMLPIMSLTDMAGSM